MEAPAVRPGALMGLFWAAAFGLWPPALLAMTLLAVLGRWRRAPPP